MYTLYIFENLEMFYVKSIHLHIRINFQRPQVTQVYKLSTWTSEDEVTLTKTKKPVKFNYENLQFDDTPPGQSFKEARFKMSKSNSGISKVITPPDQFAIDDASKTKLKVSRQNKNVSLLATFLLFCIITYLHIQLT